MDSCCTGTTACPATTTLDVLQNYGSTGCQWGDKVFHDFIYFGDAVPGSAVTVTFSAAANPASPLISFLGNWSAANGNWDLPFIEYSVSSPSASPMLAATIAITGQVSNVDPVNQIPSFIVDAGAVFAPPASNFPLNVEIDPPGADQGIATGPVTLTGSSTVSIGAQTQIQVIVGLVLFSTEPDPSVGLQQGNPASVSRIDVVVAVSVPAIASLSASYGAVGTPVTITGSGFGSSQGTSTVTFNGVDAGTAVSWSDTSITVNVPSGATTGDLIVTVNGVPSVAAPFTVTLPPAVSSLTPQSGPAGTAVTITGSHFGATQDISTVTFGGMAAGTAASWSDASITVYVPGGAATGDVVVTVGGAASNPKPFTVTIPPAVSGVFPTSGPAGTPVTIAGSGFGASQGASSVTFNGTAATATSWSDTRIAATVPAGASSGNLAVTVAGMASSGVYFRVTVPPVISGLSPITGGPGDSITITGSGFGASQGNGAVWLGTAYGTVVTWSDTQVVATVAAGSKSGTAQVLQGGVWSNAKSFGVNTPTLADVSPTAGVPGTQVTFSGAGFGTSQGSGSVQLGSMPGQVVTWSDTQIVAAVASGSLTGIARVQQNGVWSNAVAFTVTGTGTSGVTMLTPNVLNMVVGDTQTVRALDASSRPVSGLTWNSSDPTVVSLSTDDPPLLTAVAAGHVTITAGGASADVTVWPAGSALPPGTVLWSNPVNGAAANNISILPAVPSPTGLADVFALTGSTHDSKVYAITSDGATAWTADLSDLTWPALFPDFQGGVVVESNENVSQKIVKLDGITGQRYPAYTAPEICYLDLPVPHPDGTIFTTQEWCNFIPNSVIGIDPATGALKFQVPIPRPDLPQGGTNWGDALGHLIIAGDGYAYVMYESGWHGPIINPDPSYGYQSLRLFRISSSGTVDNLTLGEWNWTEYYDRTCNCRRPFGAPAPVSPTIITNADTGVLVAWYERTGVGWTLRLANVTGTGVSIANGPQLPSSSSTYPELRLELQAQDGSFFATTFDDNLNPYTASFDASGNLHWVVPNVFPVIATADGGFIGQTIPTYPSNAQVFTFDQNGYATGQMASLPTYSWLGNAYQTGSVDQLQAKLIVWAATWWAQRQGNASGNGAAAKVAQIKLNVSTLKGTQNIDLAEMVKDAQNTWSKQSNGTIALLWDHSIQSIDPCAVPNCGGTDTSNLLNLLPYSPNDRGNLWVQTNYFLQKFPNRQGINVVHNATIPTGYAITLPVPLAQYQQFVDPAVAESNIILLPNATSKVLGHEVGHVLGLPHVSNPLNLMCGIPPGTDGFVAFVDSFWCFQPTAYSLNADQLTTAKAKALNLVEK